MFDINNDEWISGKSRTCYGQVCGMYYNEPDDIIYVGGGYDEEEDIALKDMEYYNLEKDVWSSLPDTNKGHDMYPLIWLEDNNLLHIMSISSNCIECLDLREGKKWEIQNDNVAAMFNTEFKGDIDNAVLSRLVGN